MARLLALKALRLRWTRQRKRPLKRQPRLLLKRRSKIRIRRPELDRPATQGGLAMDARSVSYRGARLFCEEPA